MDYSVPRKDCIVCHYPIWSEVCGQYSDEALCNFKFGFGLLVLLYTIKFMFYALKYLLQHQPTLVLPQIQISLERWFPEDWVLLQIQVRNQRFVIVFLLVLKRRILPQISRHAAVKVAYGSSR